ncbi:DUF928 domain-containing protein [Phormidesmis priestleyi]
MSKVSIRYFWGWIASLTFLILIPHVANSQPPKETPPQTGGRSGGTRGCDAGHAIASNDLPALMLLTPNQVPAKTTTTRPTFAWLIREAAPQPLIFRLYQYEPTRQTVHLVMELRGDRMISQPGIMVLSLSESAISAGQRYLWQVELVCDPNYPSSNVFAEADIEVVAAEPELLRKVAKADRSRDRITLYLEAGLWHDALRLALVDDRSDAQKIKNNASTMILLRETAITDTELNSLKVSPIHQILH